MFGHLIEDNIPFHKDNQWGGQWYGVAVMYTRIIGKIHNNNIL